MQEIKNVFLGGTCNKSTWRDQLIERYEMLTENEDTRLNFYNPVVPNWTAECQEEEIYQKKNCDLQIFCITPKMSGVFSIAEMVDLSNKYPERLIVVFLPMDDDSMWSMSQWKSLMATRDLIEHNGCKNIYYSIYECADNLNKIWLSVGPKTSPQ